MKILRFDDLEKIEYRKGSSKYGQLLLKLMEYLRIYKSEENILIFSITDFEKESNIKISEIVEMINDDDGKNLYKFNIIIDDEFIKFENLTSNKNRFFEQKNNV